MDQLQKSPNWDAKNHLRGTFVKDGFPFNEGFPNYPVDKTYTIITRDGKEYPGTTVDLSRQYSNEGKQWLTRKNGYFRKYVVVCWKEEPPN